MIDIYHIGTRIYYDRAFLLSRRDSPMARSPPNLPYIPEGWYHWFEHRNSMNSVAAEIRDLED